MEKTHSWYKGNGFGGKERPWEPRVSLISHSTAPLSSRIPVPATASAYARSLQPVALSKLSAEEQEEAILADLIYTFVGVEGEYIRYDNSYDPAVEKSRLLGLSFAVLPGLKPSLVDLTNSVLRLSSYYKAVEACIEILSREELGTVNHALCGAIREFFKEYFSLITQLEHQILTDPSFTLNVLNLRTKTMAHLLSQLYGLCLDLLRSNSFLEEDSEESTDDMDDVENILESLREGRPADGAIPGKKGCIGGSVLGLVTQRLASFAGDPSVKNLLQMLLREASRPYMTMLNEWLHHGSIKDPHGEFMIKEQKSIKRERLDQDYTDEYWEKRYTIRDRDRLVPPQLETLKEKVLLAGKYLNVVRECGGIDISQEVSDIPKSFDDPRFLENVNNAYSYANNSLLNLLLTTHALPARLKSLKHYFFLDRSDFFTYFLELGASELRKPAKNVNVGKLQSLLDIVLHQPGSVAAEDPFKDDVKVQMNEIGLTNWLMMIVNVTGIDQDTANTGSISKYLTPAPQPSVTNGKDIIGFDALVLDYAMPFPLSLVVSRVTLTRYQLLFRYLLSLRHLETILSNSWIEHSKADSWRHRSSNRKVELWKRKAWTLRAKMLVFVQQLLYYCTAEVIEPNWQSLMSRLNESDEASSTQMGNASAKRTVDELMQDHVDFLATCLKECMLTNSKLLKVRINLFLINSIIDVVCRSTQRFSIHARCLQIIPHLYRENSSLQMPSWLHRNLPLTQQQKLQRPGIHMQSNMILLG